MAWVVSNGLHVTVGKVPTQWTRLETKNWDISLSVGKRRFQASIKQAYKKQAMKLGSLELGH